MIAAGAFATMALALGTSAHPVVVEPVHAAGQTEVIADGRSVATAEVDGLRVAATPATNAGLQEGGRAELVLYVVNTGVEPLEFGPEHLRLTSPDGALELIAAERLAQEIEHQARMARADATRDYRNSYPVNTPTSFSGSFSNAGDYRAPRNTSGGYGGTNALSASDASSGKNKRAAIKVRQKQIDTWEQQSLAAITTLALRRSTIAPGESAYGHVFVALPKRIAQPLPLTLNIDAGGRTLALSLIARPQPKPE